MPAAKPSPSKSLQAPTEPRHWVLVLGDQLDRRASAFDGFDPAQDRVWMAEVAGEATHVWSAKPRIAMFLAALRHFAAELQHEGIPLHYRKLDDAGNRGSLAEELAATLSAQRPRKVIVTEPGEWRLREDLQRVCDAAGVPLEIRDDRHFFSSVADFRRHAQGRKQLRMEFFYREQRQRHRILMDEDGQGGWQPAGGRWNFDTENRGAFDARGPGFLPASTRFEPDAITREVIALVEQRFADHPGRLASFAWPVTRAQSLQSLQAFVDERLPLFGTYQDAMWAGEPWLYHAHLSAAMNLKLLDPREVVAAAEAAWRAGRAPLAAVEGFVRQILGWREYVRGIYWTSMPGYLARNALEAHQPLPGFYWTGDTPMACLRDAVGQTLEHGYAHHIQRLMVTGLYALLLGVEPREVHAWYLAVYVDAVEWVELPNTLGMSQFADGNGTVGVMGSKPYAASGQYIHRMSNYCGGCRFDPKQRSGDKACPFTTLYWDFLARHRARLQGNPRMAMPLKNLDRLDDDTHAAISRQAVDIRAGRFGV